MTEDQLRIELIQKYRLAGRIRFISSSLLFAFLLLMKFMGGYSYINPALSALIVVEALMNQPYPFFLNRVGLHRFQYYQMATDIIAISWVLYYLGGIEAPVVIMAYCAVILWAGVVAGTGAVIFAVITSSFLLSSVVLLELFGMLPRISFLQHSMTTPQMFSLLIGSISFLFAFGYFSARSSGMIKLLQRKRQEESLKNTHRLMATGYLIGETAHDIRGCLGVIRGGVQVLLDTGNRSDEEKEFLKVIEDSERKGTGIVNRLARFSQKPKKEFVPVSVHAVIEDALELTGPLVKCSKMSVEKKFEENIPFIVADKDQMQEVFVAIILNSLDSVTHKPEGGALTIKTEHLKDKKLVEIMFADTGIGVKQDDLKRVGEPFFSTKGPEEVSGLGLATAFDIIERHHGKIHIKSKLGEGAAVIIQLPVKEECKIAAEK